MDLKTDEVEALAGLLTEALVALEQADPAAAAAIIGPTLPWGLTPEDDARLIRRADVALAAVGSALHPMLAERFAAVVGRLRGLADEIEEVA